MLFDEEVKFGEDIDFKYPMKAACSAEMDKFCACEPFLTLGLSNYKIWSLVYMSALKTALPAFEARPESLQAIIKF